MFYPNIKMEKIIILAGNGLLPNLIIKKCKLRNICFNMLYFTEKKTMKKSLTSKKVTFGNVLTELKKLKKNGFNKILMAGSMQRPNLKDLKPDVNSLKLLPKFIKKLMEGGDNNLLTLVISELEKFGFKILSLKNFLPEIFIGKGNQTKCKISKSNLYDIKKGVKILSSISKFDIGQSIIMQHGTVIGIEAAQGTDNLIKQSYRYLKNVNEGVLIKMIKKKQDIRVDLPTIGLRTVKYLKKYSLEGLAYSSNKTVILNKDQVIKYCEKNNIFLFGV